MQFMKNKKNSDNRENVTFKIVKINFDTNFTLLLIISKSDTKLLLCPYFYFALLKLKPRN